MINYEKFMEMSDKELLKVIATEGGAGVGSYAGSEQLHIRDSAKATLDYRLREKIETLNTSIKNLNRSTSRLNWILIVLTIILVVIGILTLLCNAFH